MHPTPPNPQLVSQLQSNDLTRIVAFGSSNTERGAHSMGRFHWLDWLEVGLRETYGRVHHTINTGICGDTSRGLRTRFDRDVAWYRPDIVIVTIGGNDSSPAPDRNLSIDEFAGNLRTLVEKIRALPNPCIPLLQTYYSADLERCPPETPTHPQRFLAMMQIVRDVATNLNCPLVDHLARWERLRLADVETSRGLMQDWMHVNPRGNMVLGLDLMRYFGAASTDWFQQACQAGLTIQQRLDELEAQHA